MRWIDFPPIWLCGCLVLAWVGAGLMPLGTSDLALRLSGALLILTGAAVTGLALLEMRRSRTTFVPRQSPEVLVRAGVFRLSRNPIYLSDLMILAGASLIWGSLPGLVLVPVLGWVLSRRFIEGEEAALRAAFGAAFDEYAARTRRWL